jgi:DNA-binding NarL/FixJ family response regulator
MQPKPSNPSLTPIKILIADDHQIFRQGLKNLLSHESAFRVVGEASDGRSAVQMASELQADIVVMDIAMPAMDGIEATRQLTSALPATKIIALSMHTSRRFADEMIKAGAKGYVLKDGAFEELAEAIRVVLSGKIYLSPRVSAAANGDGNGNSPHESPVTHRLSPRERDVLRLLAQGRSTKEIAGDLELSVKTIETHRRQFMDKLNLFSVAELTKYAIREGLASVDA